jgi:16S rRNA (cytosine967-C5)-methyltransferase
MTGPLSNPRISRTPRAFALEIFHDCLRRGVPLDEGFAGHGELAKAQPRDRAFVRLVVATALRRLGQIDAILDECLEKPIPAGYVIVRDILRMGAAQLLFLKTPPHAAVDTSVRMTVERGRGGHSGLVNAVLRRVSRNGEAMLAAQDAAKLNTPEWLWESWVAAYGEETARAIAEANMKEPPLDISVKGDPKAWAEKLGARILPTGTLRRPPASEGGGGMVAELPGFEEGAWWVQDAAAAIPAMLFGDVSGKAAIDLCAAPGGKTAQLAVRGAKVIALDSSRRRLDIVAENLKRLKLEAELVRNEVEEWRPREPAPFVLLDAPCTATGTMRRHPDIARLKTAGDVARLAAHQDRMLNAAFEMTAPGGLLVYCVCSLQPEEGVQRIEALLARNDALAREPIQASEIGGLAEAITKEGDLRTLPSHLAELGGIDGFYAARLRRRNSGFGAKPEKPRGAS